MIHFRNSGGIRNYFFDEVHKYPGWDQELKNIYDSYPNINIVFSGSSSMELLKGTYDLARRGKLLKLGECPFGNILNSD